MKNVVSLSGGRTSAYLAHLMKDRDPETEFIFMDTGAEHPKTYEFIRNIIKHWKLKLTCLRVIPNPEMNKPSTYEILSASQIGPDLEPWKRMLRKYGHPYVGGAFCTDRMKTVPFIKYCDERFGRGNYTTWLGMRIDEPKRITPKPGIRYLAEISDFEKQDVIDWWRDQPFDLEIQEHLGNCVFCIKKSIQKVALAAKDEPELAANFIHTLQSFDVKPDKVMYRSNNSLEQVIALFSDTGRDELASRMTSMRQYDTGSCSESCEAFSGQMGFDFSMEAA
ncbi:phosphoadenosine phosphosulfate reductase family protein [Pantoea agglomerans]|uniref:phosphoadenosine phosphosulfate reductase family protein n=1 Tax=Enterobacter agglomerans TaxID=549 RepID=UPI00244BE736|nr:phosphoadenosine phosphosulfate reductase family protein [Pantoea agglomerans]MDH1171429.1 phosphoadenosine phosphosulfate reductase family protein [Pantoea agglomerans]